MQLMQYNEFFFAIFEFSNLQFQNITSRYLFIDQKKNVIM